MKRLTFALALMLLIGTSPAMADVLIPNGTSTLANSGDATEQMWLESILGIGDNDPNVTFIKKIEDGGPIGSTSINDFDPGFDWSYAIVKIGKGSHKKDSAETHYAFVDDGNGLLSPLNGDSEFEFEKGISHIAFFGNSSPVPEPATFLLLGMGIVGLAGVGRKMIKK